MSSISFTHLCSTIEQDGGLRRLRQWAAEQLSSDPGHDLSHALRVALWTLRILADPSQNRAAIAAALLHDLVNVPKNSPERASASELSARSARPLLEEAGFAPATVALICDAIRDHSFSAGRRPQSGLGRALQDADRLEALGALGIFRTVSTGVTMGAAYFASEDPWAQQRELDDRAFTVDHFFTKLFLLPERMNTALGQREARRRAATMRAFLEELALELDTPLPPTPETSPPEPPRNE